MLQARRLLPNRVRCSFAPVSSCLPWLLSRHASVVVVPAAKQPPTTAFPLTPTLPSRPESLSLRPYQEECITAVLTSFQEGHRQVGVSLATGSGKTVIFTELIGRVPPPTPHATKALILVHRKELVEQAARQSTHRYPGKTVEIEMGSMHASGQADITVASIQSIGSRDRIDKFDPNSYKLVLVDEAHHIVSPSYLRVLGHFGFIEREGNVKRYPTPALLGVSATMSRLDGLALEKAIKHIVYHKDYVDMIGEKWLSDVIFTTVASHADLSKVKKGAHGDFATSALSQAVNTSETNLITVRAWQHRAADRHSTIVFCVDLEHVQTLTSTFRAHGIDARFVTGDTHKVLRGDRLDAFKRREFPVLVNCGVFTEGTDIPNIDCVLLARPTKSRNLLIQMIGRGMRLYPGKQNCQIIDMVSSLKTGIVTTPTLFGLDPSEIVQDLDHEKMYKLKERRHHEKLREQAHAALGPNNPTTPRAFTGTLTFTNYDSVADLIDDTSGDRHIRALSPHAWVKVGDDRYVLVNGPNGSFLSLDKTSPAEYKVTLTMKLACGFNHSASPFMRPRVIVTSTTLEAAIRGADTFAAKQFARPLISTYSRNGWREDPASEAQVAFLNKYRDAEHQLGVGEVSKGKAGDMITKLKFGARGRFGKLVAARRKVETVARKGMEWEEQKRREVVRVGPLRRGKRA